MQEHGRDEPEQLARLHERRVHRPHAHEHEGRHVDPDPHVRAGKDGYRRLDRENDHVYRDKRERNQTEPVAREESGRARAHHALELLVFDDRPLSAAIVHLVRHGRLLAIFAPARSGIRGESDVHALMRGRARPPHFRHFPLRHGGQGGDDSLPGSLSAPPERPARTGSARHMTGTRCTNRSCPSPSATLRSARHRKAPGAPSATYGRTG